ncbi:MAG: hypothetical protein WCT49_05860 [Candidatus Paceibacterota bacterium]|jgi:hypothetical protein|nr:hypothetical protein [Candidatus Paceibacterota bacterium]
MNTDEYDDEEREDVPSFPDTDEEWEAAIEWREQCAAERERMKDPEYKKQKALKKLEKEIAEKQKFLKQLQEMPADELIERYHFLW